MAQSGTWTYAVQSAVARNPTDESVLLGFNYLEGGPAREEFAVALTNTEINVVIRRVLPTGPIVQTRELQAFEGIWGILFAGDAPGTLGIVRATDGVADGTTTDTGQAAIVGALTR